MPFESSEHFVNPLQDIEKIGLNFFDSDVKIDCIILAVKHNEFMQMRIKDLKSMMNDDPVLIDVKSRFIDDPEIERVYYKSYE